jgi:hypothetical protein
MDDDLAKYRDGLKERAEKEVPKFAPEAVHTAPILALLLEPDNSGAAESRIVQVHNNDPMARRTLEMIKRVGLKPDQQVLWNFYGSFEAKKRPRRFWEEETETLAKIMPNLKVVLAFGNDTWLGMQHVELPKRVVLFGAPHPSNLGVASNKKLAEGRIERAWARAKQLIDGCEK